MDQICNSVGRRGEKLGDQNLKRHNTGKRMIDPFESQNFRITI